MKELEPYHLAGLLPDEPRWVEIRWMLLTGRCRVFGVAPDPEPSFAICGTHYPLAGVVGTPSKESVRQAFAELPLDGEVLIPLERYHDLAVAFPEWKSEIAILHTLPAGQLALDEESSNTRFAELADLDGLPILPQQLRRELELAFEISPVAATFVNEVPVSFCYASGVTETLWDVSIDTVEAFRRQGFAKRTATFLMHWYARQGKSPVWGATESNTASLKLAHQLGFVEEDRILLLTRA